jgi:hypothetical protein
MMRRIQIWANDVSAWPGMREMTFSRPQSSVSVSDFGSKGAGSAARSLPKSGRETGGFQIRVTTCLADLLLTRFGSM